MTTHLIALAVETDPATTAPATWAWAELIDSPLPADVIATIETNDGATVAHELRRLAHVLLNEADQREHEGGQR